MFGSCGIAVQNIDIIQIEYSHLKLSKICWCNIFIFGERGIPNNLTSTVNDQIWSHHSLTLQDVI